MDKCEWPVKRLGQYRRCNQPKIDGEQYCKWHIRSHRWLNIKKDAATSNEVTTDGNSESTG